MKTLLIDNYDSFTYNLFQLLAEANGEEPIVVRNDGATWAELAPGTFDNIVISPGPGRPDAPSDFGVCADAIRDAEVPLLGVCLGHQGIGARRRPVVHAPEVMHGRLSAVHHDDSPLFAGIPQGFQVVRYHSLCVAAPLPADLEATAWTADGVLMGLATSHRPIWGVQFHPESICTELRPPAAARTSATSRASARRRHAARRCRRRTDVGPRGRRAAGARRVDAAGRASASSSLRPSETASSTSSATTRTLSGSTSSESTSAPLLVHGRRRRRR